MTSTLNEASLHRNPDRAKAIQFQRGEFDAEFTIIAVT
jgi:hypothetical protein